MSQDITTYLADFQSLPLKEAARQLLRDLGYNSNKFIAGIGSEPQDFLAYFDTGNALNQAKALVDEWKSADLLFQLTDQELSRASSLFTDESVQRGLLKSYIFIAIELRGSEHARSKFSAIARQINRLFPMPVMVMFKHGDRLTIAVINRRRNKLDDSKDVLEKATLIRDIKFAQPHRGHLDILASLALPNLVHPQKKPIMDFDTLHAAWEQIFNVELLNKRFYRELANWYFWALPQVEFPADLEPDDEKRRATGLIRLLTRLIFCWFLKEKGLIPDQLFHPTDLAKILKGFDPESETSSTFYHAILQNLFFATLNQRMGKDSNGNPYRVFAKDEGFPKNKATYDINNLYRYENLFAVSEDEALALFSDIPFLNGGLFECLDRTEDGTNKKRYLDGFSRNHKKRPHVPDRLFFDSGETADLSAAYGDKKRKAENVTGLISILNRYKFTIVENTPIDQEIALDPELLGKVFENLLASYNEETKTTARKQTGSFYTPRPIVDYMVDESLKAYLTRTLVEKADMQEADARAGLDILFAYTEKEHAFTPAEVATLITAIDDVKILDPACGSGAFPMGVLHKLVYLLSKLDPENVAWERLQIAKVQEITDTEERRQKLSEIVSNFADNNDDYGRKLYLIENCLYGVDIQPIAIQISKLRFFISLVCDQQTNRDKSKNHNIRPLPNLETKFVAANTLIGLPEMGQAELVDPRVYKIEADIETHYHSYFSIQRRDQKLVVQGKVKALRKEMADLLAQSLMSRKKSEHIAEWDPFDPQSSADFFDPHWMYGRSLAEGFSIVIGNPPYSSKQSIETKRYRAFFECVEYKCDPYAFFIEFALRAVRPGGVVALIVPVTWMTNVYYEKLRRRLIDSKSLLQVNLIEGLAFESANVDTSLVFLLRESVDSEKFLWGVTEPSISSLNLSPRTYESVRQESRHDIVPKVDSSWDSIRSKVELNTRKLGSFTKISLGMKLAGNDRFVATARDKEHPDPIVFGKDVELYEEIQPAKFFSFADAEIIGGTKNPVVHRTKPKILVQAIRNLSLKRRIVATLDTKGLCFVGTVNAIVPNEAGWDMLYLLGLVNSTLLNTYFTHRFTTISLTAAFLGELPIKPPASNAKRAAKISELVSRRLSKQTGDTGALESEIDQLVYALYGLTPEEIAIVESTAP
jgi:type I restriction-modification system DNA methylase subunit